MFVFLAAGHLALAEDDHVLKDVDSTRWKKVSRPLRVSVDVNWVFGTQAPAFFQDYQGLLGGHASGFDTPTGLNIAVSSFQMQDVGIGISAGYYRAVVREAYAYEPDLYPIPTGPRQGVSQNIAMEVIPAFLTVDYFPVQRQFTGYIGAGAGMAAVSFSWTETLSKSNERGARLSGERYDDSELTFAVMGHAGISLGFDDPLSHKTNAAIYFEVGYQYIPFSAPVFVRTAETLLWAPERTNGDYQFNAGGFVLRLGFSVILTKGDVRS